MATRDFDVNRRQVSLRKPDAELEKLRASGIDHELSFSVRPGQYVIRQVVRDAVDGRLTAVNSLVEIPD